MISAVFMTVAGALVNFVTYFLKKEKWLATLVGFLAFLALMGGIAWYGRDAPSGDTTTGCGGVIIHGSNTHTQISIDCK
jgi:hypothetical protein